MYDILKNISMVNKNLLTLLLLIISLISCDYMAKEYYIIENKTGFDINVAFVEKGNDKKDTVNEIVKANTIRSFYVNNTNTGMAKSKGDNYLDVFDNLWISINDSLIINKDLLKIDNWDYLYIGKAEFERRFTFTINASDLETR